MNTSQSTSTDRYQRLYDRMAPFYATGMRLLPVWQRYTETVLPWLDKLPVSGPVLEIGPGPGVLLTKLSQHFDVAVGLDLSTGMLVEAQGRLRGAGLPARLVQGNTVQLPFASGSCAAVTLTFAFSAFPKGLAAMQEIARVLCSGGLVVLVDAAEPDDRNAAGMALAKTWEMFGDFMRDEADLMQQAGLEIVECYNFGAFHSIRLTVGRRVATPRTSPR
ncbi:MAG: class I SAM-dependent methyltransferase [Anaerolineae bacterium]|nr:class I SAM-dependent methyltransferase [Anaerolineae bacterium]